MVGLGVCICGRGFHHLKNTPTRPVTKKRSKNTVTVSQEISKLLKNSPSEEEEWLLAEFPDHDAFGLTKEFAIST